MTKAAIMLRMGDGFVDHELAVAAIGGSEFRDASKDARKDESEPLTSSQKKRIKRKASKAKRNAEVSQRSGAHTRSERVLHTSPRRKLTPLSVKEKASKAMSGVHTRFREDGGDDDASDSSIEDFSAYGNSLCASPSSFS